MKFTPYLMVYKETLPIPDEEKNHRTYWQIIDQILFQLYLAEMKQQLLIPGVITNITVDDSKIYYFREPNAWIRLSYDMSEIPYYIKLKWRLQDLWARLWNNRLGAVTIKNL